MGYPTSTIENVRFFKSTSAAIRVGLKFTDIRTPRVTTTAGLQLTSLTMAAVGFRRSPLPGLASLSESAEDNSTPEMQSVGNFPGRADFLRWLTHQGRTPGG